jgi:hypothetical protein
MNLAIIKTALMLGPRNRAGDLAAALEQGLRDGAVDLWHPEDPNKKLGGREASGESRTRFLRFGLEAVVGIAFAFAWFRLYDYLTGGHLVIGLLAGALVLVGYRHLANALSGFLGRRPSTGGKTTRPIDR